MENVVEFSEVSFRYERSRRILCKVSFELKESENLSIMGLSGCGKSTVLSLLLGFLKPSGGQIKVLGKDISTLSHTHKSSLYKELGVGFQQGGLLGSLSVEDNLYFAMEKVRGWDRHEQDARVERYLRRVNLWHAKTLFPYQLSGGMKRRLSIARALCTDPVLIFLDNPTAGLDPISSRQLIKMFDSVKSLNKVKSVICLTSHVEVGVRMAKRSMILHEGKIVADRPWKAILAGSDGFARRLLMKKFQNYSAEQLHQMELRLATM